MTDLVGKKVEFTTTYTVTVKGKGIVTKYVPARSPVYYLDYDGAPERIYVSPIKKNIKTTVSLPDTVEVNNVKVIDKPKRKPKAKK